jgi:beta-mannosidase
MSVGFYSPDGFGEAVLHRLQVTLTSPTQPYPETSSSTWTRQVGLREVEVVQEPLPDQEGLTFYFRVNGVPVFIKGANWINSDQFEPRTPRTKIDSVLEAAKFASFNMLRVWGGMNSAFYSFLYLNS